MSLKPYDLRITEIHADDLTRRLRECGLSLKKLDNRPENVGVTPEMALARAVVAKDHVEDDRVRIDPPTVHPDEAVELMAHHLALAAAYYEATPTEGVLPEVLRLIEKEPAKEAAQEWLSALDDYYEDLRRKQDDEDNGHSGGKHRNTDKSRHAGWYSIKTHLPEMGRVVVCTDGARRWLDERTVHSPDMGWQGHVPTHWHPIQELPTQEKA